MTPGPSRSAGWLARWMPHSLRAQFAVALFGMGLLVVAGGATAVYALYTTGEAAQVVSRERLALLEVGQELQQRTQQIQLLSDRLVVAESSVAALRHYRQLQLELEALEALTAQLAVSDDVSVLDLHMASQLFRTSAHVIAHVREETLLPEAEAVRAIALDHYREEMQQHALAMMQSAREQSDLLSRAYQAAVQRLVETSHTSALWVVGWLAFSLFGIWLIARLLLGRHVIARLRQLSRSLRRPEQDAGDGTPPRVPVSGDDEIGSMARALERFLEDRRQLALTRARLEDEQHRLAAIIDNTADGIVVLQSGRVSQFNRAAERMFNRHQDQALGLPVEALLPGLDWHDATVTGIACDAMADCGDGKTFPVEVSLNPVTSHGSELAVLVVRDATLRKEAEQHLIEARDAAVAARTAQATFLATMSHELRTPLNAVLGYAQLLELDGSLSPRQRQAVGTIHSSGEHLLAMINDLLDLAKHEAGKLELWAGDVVLRDCLERTADIVRVKAEEAGLHFLVDIAPDVPVSVTADEKRLRQVLLNLLSNAVKFTDHGEVALSVRRVGGGAQTARLRFEVRDTGVGMPQDQLERIFQPFEQTGDKRRRSVGSGLGLAISRQLVQLMGGDIQVWSEPARGTAFSFEIEFPVVEPSDADRLPDAAITGYEGPRRHILVVDDLEANRRMLRDTLMPLGFEVHEACDGRQALEHIRAQPPDLVVMDLEMPVMDGAEAMAQIRRIETARRLPVIAVSAAVNAQAVSLGGDGDAVAFLPKPLDREHLLRVVALHLGLRWITAQAQQDAPLAE
mgnify:CR=1 FL=1